MISLQQSLDEILEGVSTSQLQKAAVELSRIYRNKGSSCSIFDSKEGALAYLATRMPATFGAVEYVLKEMKNRIPNWQGTSLLDLGAGPGTATWAALEQFPSIVKPMLLDHHLKAIEWGKKLGSNHPILSSAEWLHRSLADQAPLPYADLGICSYSLAEMRDVEQLLEKIWESKIPLFLVIEPGTPNGFQKVQSVRQWWLGKNGYLVAPCPHSHICPLMLAKNDWCHFSTRISRTKLHRLLKGGELGYEDEKFSYLILSRQPIQTAPNRILRHPNKQKGHVQIVLCTKSGQVEKKTVSRREREDYRKARDAEWGSSM